MIDLKGSFQMILTIKSLEASLRAEFQTKGRGGIEIFGASPITTTISHLLFAYTKGISAYLVCWKLLRLDLR